MDDSKYVQLCQDGNLEPFGKLYGRYNEKIYAYIYYRTHHRQVAEDLTSTVFIKAIDRIDTYDVSKGAFSSWLYRIARNTVVDHFRITVRTQDIETVWDLADTKDIELDIDTEQRIKQVKELLQTLNKEQRDIVIMRVWDEMSFKEIAEVTGKTEASCKMAFYRTIDALKKQSLPTFILFVTLFS
jgi:RNA polymerase sigma factor (sigma-70 family)